MAKTRKLTVCLDPFEFDLLNEMARQEDRSLSYVVGRCIERIAYEKAIPSESLLGTDRLAAIERKHGIDEKAAEYSQKAE